MTISLCLYLLIGLGLDVGNASQGRPDSSIFNGIPNWLGHLMQFASTLFYIATWPVWVYVAMKAEA